MLEQLIVENQLARVDVGELMNILNWMERNSIEIFKYGQRTTISRTWNH